MRPPCADRAPPVLRLPASSSAAHLKIAADGELRQQHVIAVYDVAKKAGFDKIHFVPPPLP